jgi:hypothetical protein
MQAPSVVLACRDSTMLTLNHEERMEGSPDPDEAGRSQDRNRPISATRQHLPL